MAALGNLIGRDIAGFQILSELGRGNNGVVYLARQLALNREVALKILLPELVGEPGYITNFLREARLAARLDHPNIIQALDTGSTPDGLYYFAMELVDGRTLEELRIERGRPFDFRMLLDLSIELADALDYAWNTLKMIHGDIKPGNLLICNGSRQLKLADLGLARIGGGGGADDEIMATPMYAAPEVIRGERDRVGIRSDIYSFGVMFYELVSGAPPFNGDTDTLLDRHLHEAPLPLAFQAPDIDPRLALFVDRMLAKEPEKRPADWNEVREFLRETRKRNPDPGTPEAVAQLAEALRPERRRWSLSSVVILLALALVLALLGFLAYYGAVTFRVEEFDPIVPEEHGKPPVPGAAESTRGQPVVVAVSSEPAPESSAPAPAVPAEPVPPENPSSAPVAPSAPAPVVAEPQPEQKPQPASVPARRRFDVERRNAGKELLPHNLWPGFRPPVDEAALRERLRRLDEELARLGSNFSDRWKTEAREVLAVCLLLGARFAASGVPFKEIVRFDLNSSGSRAGWSSRNEEEGMIRFSANTDPALLAEAFGEGIFERVRADYRLPGALREEFCEAFAYFVAAYRSGRPGSTAGNRLLRMCNGNPVAFIRQIKASDGFRTLKRLRQSR